MREKFTEKDFISRKAFLEFKEECYSQLPINCIDDHRGIFNGKEYFEITLSDDQAEKLENIITHFRGVIVWHI